MSDQQPKNWGGKGGFRVDWCHTRKGFPCFKLFKSFGQAWLFAARLKACATKPVTVNGQAV